MSAFDITRRQLALETTILAHPRYEAALSQLEASAQRARDPALEGRARIMVGGSGDGKTKLLRVLERQEWAQPALQGPEGDVIPLKYVEVPSRVTPRTLVSTLMKSFGETPPRSHSAEDIVDELVPIFRGVQLRLLMLDEAHWLMKSKSVEVREQNAEFIKSLINRTGVSLILAGMPELERITETFHSQMRRRLMRKIVLHPYRWGSGDERKWFIGILKHYEQALDLPEKSNLGSEDVARRLFLVSRGSLGVVVQYLSSALEIVAERGGRKVALRDLSQVHQGLIETGDIDLGGEMSEFRPEVIDNTGDPFLCTEAQLLILWKQVFGKPDDLSRRTGLAPGKRK